MTVLNVCSLLSMPSITHAFALACEPSALKFDAPRGLKVEAPGEVLARLARGDAGHEVDERREVAPVEGQLAHGPLLDHLADLARVRARERRERHHLGGLRQAAELEADVDAGALVHLQHHPAAHVLLEALDLDRHLVGAGDQERGDVGALGVGDEAARGALALVVNGDGGAGNDRALLVPDGPEDRPGGDLRERCGGCGGHHRQQGRREDGQGDAACLSGHGASLEREIGAEAIEERHVCGEFRAWYSNVKECQRGVFVRSVEGRDAAYGLFGEGPDPAGSRGAARV